MRPVDTRVGTRTGNGANNAATRRREAARAVPAKTGAVLGRVSKVDFEVT